jgi:hypothetical protein
MFPFSGDSPLAQKVHAFDADGRDVPEQPQKGAWACNTRQPSVEISEGAYSAASWQVGFCFPAMPNCGTMRSGKVTLPPSGHKLQGGWAETPVPVAPRTIQTRAAERVIVKLCSCVVVQMCSCMVVWLCGYVVVLLCCCVVMLLCCYVVVMSLYGVYQSPESPKPINLSYTTQIAVTAS